MAIKGSDLILGAAALGVLYLGYRGVTSLEKKISETNLTPNVSFTPNVVLPAIQFPNISLPDVKIETPGFNYDVVEKAVSRYVSPSAPQNLLQDAYNQLAAAFAQLTGNQNSSTGANQPPPIPTLSQTNPELATNSGKYLPSYPIPTWVGAINQSGVEVKNSIPDILTGQSFLPSPKSTTGSTSITTQAPATTTAMIAGASVKVPRSSVSTSNPGVIVLGANSAGGGGTLYARGAHGVIKADGTRID